MSTTPRAGEGFILEVRQENHRSLLTRHASVVNHFRRRFHASSAALDLKTLEFFI